jgi:hypothetical protein
MGLFANSLLPQACFCGEACLHGLQVKAKVGPSFRFHARCLGTQCKSCYLEDAQTLYASIASRLMEKQKTLNTPFILSNFSDYQFNIKFMKISFHRFNKYVRVQSPPMYLQNLSLLL